MYELIERRGGSTVFKWGSCLLTTLMIVAVVIHCSFAIRYDFEGERLTLVSISEGSVIMKDRADNEAKLVGSPNLLFSGGTNTVTYLDRTFSCTADWDDFVGSVYHFSDGTTKMEPMLSVTFDYGDGSSPDTLSGFSALQRAEYRLLDKMQSYMRDGHPIWQYVWQSAFALIVLLVGMALLCFPQAFWRLNTMFIVQGGEPTDWAIFSNRTAGLLLIVFAFVIPFLR